MGHSRLMQYSLQTEGLTVLIQVRNGGVIVRGSFTVQNTTPLMADFTVQSNEERDKNINYFISLDLYKSSTNKNYDDDDGSDDEERRKQALLTKEENDKNCQVYLSIVGLYDTTIFSLNTTIGDVTTSKTNLQC